MLACNVIYLLPKKSMEREINRLPIILTFSVGKRTNVCFFFSRQRNQYLFLAWRIFSLLCLAMLRKRGDWEQEEIVMFMYLLYSTRIKRDADDQLCWQPSKSSLFEVKVSFGPWSFDYLVLFGVQWVVPQRIVDVLACWKGSFGHRANGAFWRADPLYLLWMVWKECNCQAFEGLERPSTDLKLVFLCVLYEWTAVLSNFSSPSLITFIDSCSMSWVYFSFSVYF